MDRTITKTRSLAAALAVAICLTPAVGLAQGAPDARTKALIEGAQKEGELVYIDNLMAPESRKVMQDAFLKRYGLKNFKITPYLLKSSEVVARVDQELKADRVSADWVLVNVATFWREMQERGALLKYCSPEYEAFEALEAKAGLLDGDCYFKASIGVAFTPMWNPKYVKENLDSWEKLVDPKYKGQVIFSDPLKGAVYLDTYIGLRKVLPLSWFKKMAEQKPFFLVRSTDIRDKVMTGEYPIAALGYAPRAYQVRKDVQLDVSYPKEGIVLLGSFGGIMAKAKHPNAAKLWTDFFYSKEGMAILRKHEAVIAGRGDLPPDPEVEKYVPSITKLNLIKVDWDKLTEADRKAARAEFESVFNR